MNLYNITLKSLIMKNINCDQLPHTIQKDVNQLLEFKTKLKRALRMKEQIDKITVCIDDNTYELELIQNGLLWQNSNYDEYEEIQNDIERLEQEKEELEMCLGNYESDVIDARKDIENNIASNIDCNILCHLEQTYHY